MKIGCRASMRYSRVMILGVWVFLHVVGPGPPQCAGAQSIKMEASAGDVGKYQKLEFRMHVGAQYSNPFDPNEVEVTILLRTPSGKRIALPAFYCQDYEQRRLKQGNKAVNWLYPVGEGAWKARFSPTEIGTYSATAMLREQSGESQSDNIQFQCRTSASRGFVRVSQKDTRFFEFSEGGSFFAIGQNLAFIGEDQYVTPVNADEILGKLARNGANFLRIWTCCADWALAIEALKSAWDRSWHRNASIVPMPSSENAPNPRKCVRLAGSDGASITVSPCHPVGLRPKSHYVLVGQFKADGPRALRVGMGRGGAETTFVAATNGEWTEFKREFTTGENDFWLDRVVFSLAGAGTVWLDGLSLKEAGGGAELLWEADVNRPVRGFYNQVDCLMLDQLVESAQRNGIYLVLCVITRDLYMKSLADDKSPEYRQAIEDAKKLMRYVVARWGYSTAVAAWEYFNEIDPGLPTERFYREVGGYLEQIDAYHHLRATSTWHPSAKDCRNPNLDIAQLHHYMRPETNENYKDEVEAVMDKTRFLREHAPDKPVLIGEFGLATPKWGLSEHMKQDTEAVHFHNSLWASAFAGASGTALFWWWEQLDRQDAYHHYKPLADFLADVSFEGLKAVTVRVSTGQLRVLGYQGSNRAHLWLFNQQATWWNLVIEKQKLQEIKDATVEIQGLEPGDYTVEWWDTHTGDVIRTERVSFPTGSGRISIPPFSRDIACKVRQ